MPNKQLRCQVSVRVLSGGEEACLAAMGVLCGTPEADGIVCDLGGGSLELVTVTQGNFGKHVTMPLGLLRCMCQKRGSLIIWLLAKNWLN